MKNQIVIWSSSYSEREGEGKLARLFIKKMLFFYGKKYDFIFINKKKNKNNNLFHKYIEPFLGLILLWKYFFLGKKIQNLVIKKSK